MRKKIKASFDPKKFLAKVGEGKTVSSYRKDQIVFSQGDLADAVFYIQQGKVKLTVVSEQGKEAVVAIVGPGHFFGEGCLNGHPVRIATKGGRRWLRDYPPGKGDHDRHHSQRAGLF
jgi:CRP-like cAMP-binding protein